VNTEDNSPKPTPRRRWTPAQIQQLLEQYRTSKLTRRAFAASHGVGLSTLGNWLRKARTVAPRSPRWLEVPLPASLAGNKAAGDYRLEIRGSTLHVPRGFECGEVKALAQLFFSLS
jgi:hypothetical protein